MSAPPLPPPAPPAASSALEASATELSSGMKVLFAITSVCLVIGSGLVSGLTLGLLSQDEMDLEVLRRSGTAREAARAARVSAVLANPHLLLCTLVLVNAACSVSLPIFLDRLLNAVASILISVTAILIFGEILPQAICARHGVAIGAFFAPSVRVLMVVCAPIAWPLAKVLDYWLGRAGNALNRPQLQAMVSLHHAGEGMGGNLTKDEVAIISGALKMTGRTGRRAMTPISRAFMVSDADLLDAGLRERILRQGHSRIPVYKGSDRTELVGLILAKELLHFWGAGGEGAGAAPPPRVGELLLRQLPRLPADTSLYDLLNVFQTGRSHMAALMDTREDAAAAEAAAAAAAAAAAGGAGGGGGGAADLGNGAVVVGTAVAAAATTTTTRAVGTAAKTTTTAKAVATAGDAAAITTTTTTTTNHPHVAVSFAPGEDAVIPPAPAPAREPSVGRRLLKRLTSAGGGGGSNGTPASRTTTAESAGAADAGRTVSGGSAGSHNNSNAYNSSTNARQLGGGARCAARTHSGGSEASAAALAAESEAQRAQTALDVAAHGVPVGIITLEDVLEELMGEEILDETDAYADVATGEPKDAALAEMLQDVPPHMRKLLQLHLFEAGKVLARATPQLGGVGAGVAAGVGGGGVGAAAVGVGGGVGGGGLPGASAPPTRPGSAAAAAVAGSSGAFGASSSGPSSSAHGGLAVQLAAVQQQRAAAAAGGAAAAPAGRPATAPIATATTTTATATTTTTTNVVPPPLPPAPPPPHGTRPMMVPLPRGAGLAAKGVGVAGSGGAAGGGGVGS
jgi:metal transporter CNNM